MQQELPVPSFFNPKRVSEVWRVPYAERAAQAAEWAKQYDVKPAASDHLRVCLMPIDCQLTFCNPDFELFVGGQSGTGAIDDNIRLCEFGYRNLSFITEIDPTLDTHLAMQIFHPLFWINDAGEHPVPAATMISVEDVEKCVWRVNPAVARNVYGGDYVGLQAYALHYVRQLQESGKYALTIWPYHAMLGGIGHALVPSVEEMIFFHGITRCSLTQFQIKGGNTLTENYSVLAPEVLSGPKGTIAQRNTHFFEQLMRNDVLIIAGQAKSHCVAWTIDDLLGGIQAQDPELAKKVYLLEDCTSPVVIPGVIDFTDMANTAFQRFRDAGMHVVQSTDPIESWPGIDH